MSLGEDKVDMLGAARAPGRASPPRTPDFRQAAFHKRQEGQLPSWKSSLHSFAARRQPSSRSREEATACGSDAQIRETAKSSSVLLWCH